MMPRVFFSSLLTILVCLIASTVPALEPEFESILRFEAQDAGAALHGWGGGPHETIHLDTTYVHEGEFSVRLERDASSAQGFSTITKSIPADFTGDWIEMSGFIRTEGVTEFAGLWMRQDGPGGMVQFDNMQGQGLKGTTEWKRYSIKLPLDDMAEDIFFGFLVAGQGKAWVDDIEMLVDGKLLREAPERVREKTILDTDLEFTEGSGFAEASLSEMQVDNLATLAWVWGFLKYHHPRVAAGDLHWDFELFRVMPAVLAAKDPEQANTAMADWIDRIGLPETCDPCADDPVDAHLLPDLGWIEDEDLLGDRLTRQLQQVHRFRNAEEEQFYLTTIPNVKNPVFENELTYLNRKLPDPGYRFLALARVWNIIEYWFPYRDLLDHDWTSVLHEFVPRFWEADTWDDYRLELFALAAYIKDGHANLWREIPVRPPVGECVWPVEIRFLDGRATVVAHTDSLEGPTSGLEPGDVIKALDGRPLEDLLEEWKPYYCSSNDPTMFKDLGRALSRGECGPGEVGIERGGASMTVTVERLSLPRMNWLPRDRPGDTFQMLSDEVAYLKLSTVAINDVPDYLDKAAGTKGLVVDIRNYPSEFVVFALGSRLITEPTAFASFTRCDVSNPGTFTWYEGMPLQPAAPAYEGKVVILVDDSSMSQAEYTAMALRAGPNAMVVGSTTAGADGNVSNIPLPGDLKLMMSGIGVFYPDKTSTQRVGIVPDVFVTPTSAGIVAGRDEVLEAALREILGEGTSEDTLREMAKRP